MSAWFDLRHGVLALLRARIDRWWLALRQRVAHQVLVLAVRLSVSSDEPVEPSLAARPLSMPTPDVSSSSSSGFSSITCHSPLATTGLSEAPYRLRAYADVLHQPYRPHHVETRYLVNRLVVAMQLLEYRPPRWEQAFLRLVVDLIFAVGVDRIEDTLHDEVSHSPINQ